ncbi:MAG: propionyl-CoA synthetase [Pelagibacteraceae bacterium TMED216]|nr:MAG: propionyl-CoA synthetase [Pelagibacteraceae bacterium TMED216]|tara:strand:- start:2326 stop:4257 length:1932 start_codon:yes stop_codon:yes gene_type:complete
MVKYTKIKGDTLTGKYKEIYDSSINNKEEYWKKVSDDIFWYKKPTKILNTSNPPFYKWYEDGITNTCYNAVDLHIDNGKGEKVAIIYDSPITGKKKKYTFNQLKEKVALFAGALVNQGVGKGDRIIIYMPMIPEAVVAMLACGRIGAIHSVVFGGFAANELASRIDDCKAKIIVSASCGYEPGRVVEYKPLLNKALELSNHKPDKCIIFQREKNKASLNPSMDISWEDAHKNAKEQECVKMNSNDYAYILYTSGTTGLPKGIVRDIGGHIVALKWTMKNIYNINPDDVWWSASDIGWIVGHSYIVYGPLFYGCTTILFEGKPVGTPDAGVFWRVISEHKVKSLFTAPTAIRAIKKEDPEGKYFKKYDLSQFDTLFLAGERADPDTIKWFEKLSGSPVVDHWWQTETSWAITSSCTGIEKFPVKYGSAFKPVPGYDLKVLNSEGKQVGPSKMGDIVVKLPLPPGTFPTLWGADKRYKDNYMSNYPGYYQTYDAGHIDEDGYVWIMSRTDDIINVAGHRLSTGAIEEVLAEHKSVAECAVIGIADKLKGQLPIGLLALKAGVDKNNEEIIKECIGMVREKVGPVAAFKTAIIVKRLPKTRSGKVLRGTVRKIADNEPYKMPATIDDPAILDEIKADLIANKILEL